MTKHDTPVARQRSSVVALTQTVDTPLSPGRIAFLGAAADADASVFVQTLCWPVMADAWTALTRSWQAINAGRGGPDGYIACTKAVPPSAWVSVCAPQLGAPFRGTGAEESSVAALVARTPMQIAIATVDDPNKRGSATGATPLMALSSCLTTYHQIASLPGRQACSLLVSGRHSKHSANALCEAFARCRSHMPEALWLGEMQLRLWKEPVEPLPLELAHVVAESVVRHRLHPKDANPIFDAVRTKRVQDPFHWRPPGGGRS